MDPDTTRLDRGSAEPLYLQIAASLRSEILGHDLAPGSQLPSEAVLRERFGVARSVVRQAVGRLAEEGLVHRRQGAPSVVALPSEHRRLVQRTAGMFDQFARAGHRLRTRVDVVETGEPPPDVVAFLRTHDAWHLERLRSVGDEPLSYVRTWLPRSRVPALDAADLEDASLHRLLIEQQGLRPRSGRRQIRAVAADERLADALGVEPGAPLLLLEGESVDQHGRPLEWFTTWHRADKVVFDVDVTDTADVVTVDRVARPGTEVAQQSGQQSGQQSKEPGPTEDGPARPDLDRARQLLAELRELLGPA